MCSDILYMFGILLFFRWSTERDDLARLEWSGGWSRGQLHCERQPNARHAAQVEDGRSGATASRRVRQDAQVHGSRDVAGRAGACARCDVMVTWAQSNVTVCCYCRLSWNALRGILWEKQMPERNHQERTIFKVSVSSPPPPPPPSKFYLPLAPSCACMQSLDVPMHACCEMTPLLLN